MGVIEEGEVSRWLCKIGLHRWKRLGSVSFVDPTERIYRCERCDTGKIVMLNGTLIYHNPKWKELS